MPDPNADVAVDSSDLVYDVSVDARP